MLSADELLGDFGCLLDSLLRWLFGEFDFGSEFHLDTRKLRAKLASFPHLPVKNEVITPYK